VAIAALGVLVAPAGLAAADKSAQQTIDDLQSKGYTVTIDKIGTRPLSDCVVTSVRNPQQVTQPVVVDGGGFGRRHRDLDVIDVVVHQSISVSLDCTR
jgi:hypothetical protein